jgi:hypothetical protein
MVVLGDVVELVELGGLDKLSVGLEVVVDEVVEVVEV